MKKKIFLLITFVLLAVGILYNGNKNEVKAEEKCETYTNYYLLLDATDYGYLNELIANDQFYYVTDKDFPLTVPDGAEITGEGAIPVTKGGNQATKNGWGSDFFYDKFTSIPNNDGILEEGNNKYSFTKSWRYTFNCSGTTCEFSPITTEYTPLYGLNSDDFAASMATPTTQIDAFAEENGEEKTIDNLRGMTKGKVTVTIARTFTSSTLPKESDVVKREITVDGDTSERQTVWSPAVYYIEYTYCEEEVTETPTYTLTVEHLLDGTTNKLKDDYTEIGYKTGDKDTYSCPSIDGYTVVNSSNNPSEINVEFEDEDITRQCYYTENTYTLTINYGSDEDCSKTIANPTTYDGLKAGVTITHEIKSSIGDLSNPKLGTVSNAFNTKPKLNDNKISATMPAKNVEICVVYTPQTGASWIYLAWVIGGLALGYSIWYFVRYYKKQNNEI